jgi:hypothetical protein
MNKIMIVIMALGLACLAAIAGCTKQNEEALATKNGGLTCDTVNISYSSDITPLLATHCYECHGTNSSAGSGGVVLEGYSHLLTYAQNGTLAGCVSHAPGFVPMPYLQPELPSCDVNTIVAWVNQGARNN